MWRLLTGAVEPPLQPMLCSCRKAWVLKLKFQFDLLRSFGLVADHDDKVAVPALDLVA